MATTILDGLAGWNNLFSTAKKNKLANQQAEITNQYLPDELAANNAYKLAMSRYLGSPAQFEKGMSPEGKLLLEQQLTRQGGIAGLAPTMGGNMIPPSPTANAGGNGLAAGYPVLPGGRNPANIGATQSVVNDIQKQNIAQAPDGTLRTRDQIGDIYDAALQKRTSDVQTRNKAKYAINIDKTLARIDPNVMSYYTGPAGALRLKKDMAASLMGNSSPEFVKFQTIVSDDVPVLADQVRQFYGDSIQPSVRASLESLANPANWKTQPDVMMAKFNEMKALLGNETDTYLNNLDSPLRPEQAKAEIAKFAKTNNERVTVISKDGTRGTIPASQLDAALKAGYKKA
jgi:hypothetical protein